MNAADGPSDRQLPDLDTLDVQSLKRLKWILTKAIVSTGYHRRSCHASCSVPGFLYNGSVFGAEFQQIDNADLPPEVLLLSKIKARAAKDSSHLQSCTCLVTLERSTRDTSNKPFKYIDTVDAEVADINGHEMYAWPGTPQFRLTGLSQLVGTGLAGTGVFSTFAVNLFVVDAGTFRYADSENLSGTPAARL